MTSVPTEAFATLGSNIPTDDFSTGWFMVSATRLIETNCKSLGERTLLAKCEEESVKQWA